MNLHHYMDMTINPVPRKENDRDRSALKEEMRTEFHIAISRKKRQDKTRDLCGESRRERLRLCDFVT